MKKTGKITAFLLLGLMVVAFVSAQSASLWSASPTGVEKNKYSSTDSIYVKSSKVCEPATDVDLYIVENSDDWVDGEELVDVRGDKEVFALVNGAIPLTKVWESPEGGDYDMVIDCNKNGVYDEFIDKVDSFTDKGFSVDSIIGTVKAEKGLKNPADHQWQYDSEEIDLYNEVMQLSLTAAGEDIEVYNITLTASGSGDDTALTALEIYSDDNNNGKVDNSEVLIGEIGGFEEDDGQATIDMDYYLTKGESGSIVIAYVMPDTLSTGDFILTVNSIIGYGVDSEERIAFGGLPISSGKTTVVPEKTCFGEIEILLDPNPAINGSTFKAVISGVDGCDGKTVTLRNNPCGSSVPQIAGNCVLANETCEVSIKALKELTYHACLDKNGDGDGVDFGEYAYDELSIEYPVIVEGTNETEGVNETETSETEEEEEVEETNTTGILEDLEVNELTGASIGAQITESNSFFILLEVTLLLILFVLVMILFRLKPVVVEAQKAEKSAKKEKAKAKGEDEEEE